MSRRLAIALLGCAVLTALVAGLVWFAWVASRPPAAPGFALVDRHGRPHRLVDYRGRVVVLNFWAPWCKPCRAEMPLLNRAARTYRDRGVVFIGVAMDERIAVERYLARRPNSFVMLLAGSDNTIQARYTAAYDPAGALPYTVIVNRSGRIVWRNAGQLSPAVLTARLSSLLGAEPADE